MNSNLQTLTRVNGTPQGISMTMTSEKNSRQKVVVSHIEFFSNVKTTRKHQIKAVKN
jgi:hypothetical protein